MQAVQGATKSGSEAYDRTPQRLYEKQRRNAPHIALRSQHAHVAQSAERVLGKDEVSGSIPLVGSSFRTH